MKLPLKLCVQSDGKYANVRDADGHRIATDLSPDAAALVVTACNSHAKLVAALHEVRTVPTLADVDEVLARLTEEVAL